MASSPNETKPLAPEEWHWSSQVNSTGKSSHAGGTRDLGQRELTESRLLSPATPLFLSPGLVKGGG